MVRFTLWLSTRQNKNYLLSENLDFDYVDTLLRKKLKLELESEFSAKELAMETKRMDLENKLKNLENNKDKENFWIIDCS